MLISKKLGADTNFVILSIVAIVAISALVFAMERQRSQLTGAAAKAAEFDCWTLAQRLIEINDRLIENRISGVGFVFAFNPCSGRGEKATFIRATIPGHPTVVQKRTFSSGDIEYIPAITHSYILLCAATPYRLAPYKAEIVNWGGRKIC